ncbi:hypothetical protein GOP47_0012180 [Adiantum capillus-veneris]|uniref:Uncharacterized protein n=1 Tax=Adiantum capillus-veneris TaxID=13818 RepID=A0A9D4UQQ0_ADICA|nr:hypothetical protein GOP47_0012180 [Adiantum capillus-veneris]
MCEDTVQVGGSFDDGDDNMASFYSILTEEGDYEPTSSPFDVDMLEEVTCEYLDCLLDEDVPLEVVTGAPRELLTFC